VKKFWAHNSKRYFELEAESRVFFLHPWLRDYITNLNPRTILDYGAGDGSLFYTWNISLERLFLYDINKEILSIARDRLLETKKNIEIISAKKLIPKNYFDTIICSLVLMTIDNERELTNICETMYACAKNNARLIIAITHPCFRQYTFSTFKTNLSEINFDYFMEGMPFEVTLSSYAKHDSVSFTDYHWSISKTVNLFLNAGFSLKKTFELPDKACTASDENKRYPGYLVLDFKKP
jgi:hypothetical protein